MTLPDLSPSAVLEAALADLLLTEEANEALGCVAEAAVTFASVRSFEDAGVLTTDRGLVVRLSNGQSFQLSIVPCR